MIRFDCHGREVGRLPSNVARAFVPLLARRLIDVEVSVGADPPIGVELGTNVPLMVHVFLRSTALSSPSQSIAAAGVSAVGDGDKAKLKGHQKVQKDEANREVLQSAVAQMFECLQLPRKRQALIDESGGQQDDTLASKAASGSTDTGGQRNSLADCEDEEADEMSREAAVQLGGRDALARFHLPVLDLPSDVFAADLRRYQAQAVYWMWQQENPTATIPPDLIQASCEPTEQPAIAAPAGQGKGERPLHPMWDEYELAMPAGPLPGREVSRFIYHHRTSGALSLEFPDASLAYCRGGILADDMGLGKTVMCLALNSLDFVPGLSSARSAAPQLRSLEDDPPAAQLQKTAKLFQRSARDDVAGGLLVVAPLSLIRQWQAEAKKHFPAGRCPSLFEYHDKGRQATPEKLKSFGMVFTTYGVLGAEKEDGPLFQVYWRRVILDEAHAIKNRCSRQAHAAFRLRAFCRWCVTGTPLQNSVEELYSLIRFLRVDPWSSWPVWRKAIAMPLERGRHGDGKAMDEALDAARQVMHPLLIRRTKSTVDPATGEPLLVLPPKHVHVLKLELSSAERDFYDALYNRAKMKLDTLMAQGEVQSLYTCILQLILKLRQALCHPFLVFAREAVPDVDLKSIEQACLKEMTGGEGASEKFVTQLLEDLRTGTIPDCPICCDVPEDPTMTICGHIFCRECALKIPKQCHGECPVCRRPGIEKKNLKVLPGASRFPSRLCEAAGGGASGAGGGSAHSTKMKELLTRLETDMNAGRRAVVFSQWTSFLDLIGPALDAAGMNWQRFDGSLSIDERNKRVAWFTEPCEQPEPVGRVFLVSLKSGGVGLNLVAATRLYMLDMWWNPAVEEQAIQRVHRIGQTQEVHIFKFVMADTIDEEILHLHSAKERLLEDALTSGHRREGEAATKLTIEDLKRIFNPLKKLSKRGEEGAGGDATSGAAPSGQTAFTSVAQPAPVHASGQPIDWDRWTADGQPIAAEASHAQLTDCPQSASSTVVCPATEEVSVASHDEIPVWPADPECLPDVMPPVASEPQTPAARCDNLLGPHMSVESTTALAGRSAASGSADAAPGPLGEPVLDHGSRVLDASQEGQGLALQRGLDLRQPCWEAATNLGGSCLDDGEETDDSDVIAVCQAVEARLGATQTQPAVEAPAFWDAMDCGDSVNAPV